VLLDSLAEDRERMRALATRTIRRRTTSDRGSPASFTTRPRRPSPPSPTSWPRPPARPARTASPALQSTLQELREQTGELLEEVRLLSHAIHPRVLDDLGLVPALEWLARQTRQHAALDVQVDATLPAEAADMSDATAAALYRVAQEALRNVERHARAESARLTLRADGAHVILDVTDDGPRLRRGGSRGAPAGMGLFSMRERLALVGGSLTLDAAPGRGARVVARAPVDAFAPPSRHALLASYHRHPMIADVIRVILADDHAVVRAGLKAVLGVAKDIQVVGEASNGRDALAMVERPRP
jgi:signal transduction histidine kinase